MILHLMNKMRVTFLFTLLVDLGVYFLLCAVIVLGVLSSMTHLDGAEPDFKVVANLSTPSSVNDFRVIANKCEPASKTIRTEPRYDQIHAGHNCPSCGTSQYVVNQQRGTLHSHRCSRCGTEWWHSGNESSSSSPSLMEYNLPRAFSSEGCSGPACGNSGCSTTTTSRGLFGRFRGR